MVNLMLTTTAVANVSTAATREAGVCASKLRAFKKLENSHGFLKLN